MKGQRLRIKSILLMALRVCENHRKTSKQLVGMSPKLAMGIFGDQMILHENLEVIFTELSNIADTKCGDIAFSKNFPCAFTDWKNNIGNKLVWDDPSDLARLQESEIFRNVVGEIRKTIRGF